MSYLKFLKFRYCPPIRVFFRPNSSGLTICTACAPTVSLATWKRPLRTLKKVKNVFSNSECIYCTISNCSAVTGHGTPWRRRNWVVVTGHVGVGRPWYGVAPGLCRDLGTPKFTIKSGYWNFQYPDVLDKTSSWYSHMSRVQLASADVKFRRGGHGSQAMPSNSKCLQPEMS